MSKKQLVIIEAPELSGVEKSKAKQIKETFLPMAEMLEGFEVKCQEIFDEYKTGEIDSDLISRAKRVRIDIGKVRIRTGEIKDKQKEKIKLEDKAIMGVHNILVWAVKEKEDQLKDIEKHFEKMEAERLEKLQNERVEAISPYLVDAHERHLSEMENDVWDAYFNAKKKAYEDEEEAIKKAEADRVEKERLDKRQQFRDTTIAPFFNFINDEDDADIRNMEDSEFDEFHAILIERKNVDDKAREKQEKENERLKKEAKAKAKKDALAKAKQEKKDADAKAKQEKKDALAKAEQERKDKLHKAELKKSADAEIKAKRDAEKAKSELLKKQKAEAKEKAIKKAKEEAPDKDKLKDLAEGFKDFNVVGGLKTQAGKKIGKRIELLLGKVHDDIIDQINKM